jgi:hypothetical protein
VEFQNQSAGLADPLIGDFGARATDLRRGVSLRRMTRTTKKLKVCNDPSMEGGSNDAGDADYALALKLQGELDGNGESSTSAPETSWDQDLELARQLQAEWEREVKGETEAPKAPKESESIDLDMVMAQAMQAEWNAEAAAPPPDVLDLDFARKLQEEEDEMYARSRRSPPYKIKEAFITPETDALGLSILKDELSTPRYCGYCTFATSAVETGKNVSISLTKLSLESIGAS